MILNSKVIVNVIKIICFLIEKNGIDNKKKTFLLLNNVISTLDFVKILTYYIDDKTMSNDHIFFKVWQSSFSKDLKK